MSGWISVEGAGASHIPAQDSITMETTDKAIEELREDTQIVQGTRDKLTVSIPQTRRNTNAFCRRKGIMNEELVSSATRQGTWSGTVRSASRPLNNHDRETSTAGSRWATGRQCPQTRRKHIFE